MTNNEYSFPNNILFLKSLGGQGKREKWKSKISIFYGKNMKKIESGS